MSDQVEWKKTVPEDMPGGERGWQGRGGDRFRTSRGHEGRSSIPVIYRSWLQWFTWYSRRYLRRHFHSLRLSRSGPPPAVDRPLIVYCNHASWWDPLVFLVLKEELFPNRQAFAPIDAEALKRYRFFAKLGFFGVEQGSRRGAAQFLRSSQAILENPHHMLALTPQGRFADVRERPARLQAGLGHLAARLDDALVVPLAVEYVFWEERFPEILVRFGPGIDTGQGQNLDPSAWTRWFEQQLAETQDVLAREAQDRRPADFQVLLRGGAGQGGVYDWWRALKARWTGEPFNPQHGML